MHAFRSSFRPMLSLTFRSTATLVLAAGDDRRDRMRPAVGRRGSNVRSSHCEHRP